MVFDVEIADEREQFFEESGGGEAARVVLLDQSLESLDKAAPGRFRAAIASSRFDRPAQPLRFGTLTMPLANIALRRSILRRERSKRPSVSPSSRIGAVISTPAMKSSSSASMREAIGKYRVARPMRAMRSAMTSIAAEIMR